MVDPGTPAVVPCWNTVVEKFVTGTGVVPKPNAADVSRSIAVVSPACTIVSLPLSSNLRKGRGNAGTPALSLSILPCCNAAVATCVIQANAMQRC